MTKCPECGNGRLQPGVWLDEPNAEEGETGRIEQPIRYCARCMYQEVINK